MCHKGTRCRCEQLVEHKKNPSLHFTENQSSVDGDAQNSCSTYARPAQQHSSVSAALKCAAEGMQPHEGVHEPVASESSILRSHSQSDNYSHVVALCLILTRVTSAPAQNTKHWRDVMCEAPPQLTRLL